MRVLLATACVLLVQWGWAQGDWQKRADSVTSLIQKHINSKDIAALYELGGGRFKAAIDKQKFSEAMEDLYGQAGELTAVELETTFDKVAKYKAAFKKAVLSLLVGLDSTNKLETFRLVPYEKEAPPKAGAVPFNNPRKTTLDKKTDSLVAPFMKKANTVGMVLGVLESGQTNVYSYGETAKDNQLVPDGNTLFEIGSITKTFTATLLAYFVQQGKLRLDDPVNKYLPDSVAKLEVNGKPVTIRSLATHSSGLPRLPNNFVSNASPVNPYSQYDNDDLLSFLAHFKPVREPGAQYEYSNLAVGLLGVILERIAGKSYEQLLQEIIWKPLQMNNSRITLSAGDSARFAMGHGPNGNAVHSWEFQSLAACGAIRSSINDMLLYAKAQSVKDDSPLSKAIQLTHETNFEYGQHKLGLGWHIFTQNGTRYIAHDGQTGGYCSSIIVNATSGNAVVILSNASVQPFKIAIDLIQSLDQK